MTLIAMVAALCGMPAAYAQVATVSGTVYIDYNFNGVRDTGRTIPNVGGGVIGVATDTGVGGVTVRVFDLVDTPIGSTTTNASGAYSLALGIPGPYRVEFSGLPSGYEPGPQGSNNDSTVRFLSGGATGVDLGISNPVDYCQDSPTLVTSCYVYGRQDGPQPNPNAPGTIDFSSDPVLHSFPYTAGSNSNIIANWDLPPAATSPLTVSARLAGPTWGLAYARLTRTIYAAAFMKKHSAFGPDGPDAIYRIVVNPGGAGFSSITSISVPGVTTDPHDPTNFPVDNGNTAWDTVGKASLGGMDLSDDESRLYVMNLEDRTLHLLDPATGAQLDSQAVPTANVPLLAVGPPNPPMPSTCAPGDVRPFAVEYYRGQLYVGMVCSAESTNSTTLDTFVDGSNNCPVNGAYDVPFGPVASRCLGETFTDADGNGVYNAGDTRQLQALVYRVNPLTLDFDPAPALQIPLNYPRGVGNRSPNPAVNTYANAAWNPWIPGFVGLPPAPNPNFRFPIYPQPMLVDLEFTSDGSMLIGLRDRFGDQAGNGALSNPALPGQTYNGVTAGEMLRACPISGGWALESGGICGGLNGSGVGISEGPGGGEFYARDEYSPIHTEVADGGLLQVPGFPDSAATVFDPFTGPNEFFDGGFRWFSNTDGSLIKGYRVYDGGNGSQRTFGKAGGLGDLLALCDPAPIEIGNRVWLDADSDGVQDPDETPIGNVQVQLVNAQGVVIATAITDSAGRYYFSNDARRPSSPDNSAIYGIPGLVFGQQYSVRIPLNQASLNGTFVTVQDGDASTGGNARDSDGDNASAPAGSNIAPGNFTSVSFVTGGPGQNNHTYDFGFSTVPTAIVLAQFSATRQGATTAVTWETIAELDTFGFQIYRSDNGSWEGARQVTTALIPAQGRGGGASYRWLDGGSPPGGLTRYWLVEIETSGGVNRYGPISVRPDLASLPYRIHMPLIRP